MVWQGKARQGKQLPPTWSAEVESLNTSVTLKLSLDARRSRLRRAMHSPLLLPDVRSIRPAAPVFSAMVLICAAGHAT